MAMKENVKHTEAFRKWYKELLKEKKYYNLFRNTQLDLDLLVEHYKAGETPIETLNNLSTVS
jgi:hypothetical protein